MNILCRLGIHSYKTHFIPYADQPFLNDNIENLLCIEEGKFIDKCIRCGEERKWGF